MTSDAPVAEEAEGRGARGLWAAVAVVAFAVALWSFLEWRLQAAMP
jgi:hypothetical protein